MFARVACRGACDAETVHERVGENQVGRPVWSCLECSKERVGPLTVYLSTYEQAHTSDGETFSTVATDGGES